jgi:XTP/dITP diphosphohydrolase
VSEGSGGLIVETIIVATQNKDKAKEIKKILGEEYKVLTMGDAGVDLDIVEDGDSFEANALIKAKALRNAIKGNYIIVGDDSGLSVDALKGAPGIYSARYAGEDVSYDDNNKKLLREMENIKMPDRGATFICTVAVIDPMGKESTVRGEVRGKIAFGYCGESGFGYDPLFIIDSLGKTYAELSQEEKNRISHRRKALEALKLLLTD